MDVNDVKTLGSSSGKIQQANDSKPSKQLQRSLSSLSASTVDATRTSSVTVKVEARQSRSESTQARERANSVINVVNYAAEATSEIEKLVQSVGGIVEQVDGSNLPPGRSNVLEREANELIDEIRRQATSPGPNGVKPLAGDKVTVNLEENLGKTLEVLLPEDASDAFGLGTIQFSTKDQIIQTRASVENARLRLESLKDAVDNVRGSVANNVTELEVALQNSEAATATIRDVEGALEISNAVKADIKVDPEAALGSFGEIREGNAEQLLDPK